MLNMDFSPAASPSRDQQADALKKGLGRALQWAMTRRLDDEPLLAACLNDLRYDTQIEETRAEWLWKLILPSMRLSVFACRSFMRYTSSPTTRMRYQLCELARHYGETGDDTFRKRLYEIVEQKPVRPITICLAKKRSFTSTAKGFPVCRADSWYAVGESRMGMG